MARVTLISGQIQTGKTTLALELLKRECVRGLILDPVRSKPFTLHQPPLRMVTSWRDLTQFLGSPEARGRWIVCLRSREQDDYFYALEAAPHYRHVTLLVDEGLWFAQDQDLMEPVVRCCRMNAHFGGKANGEDATGMPLLITAQRPGDLPPDVRSQADRWFSFRQEEPRDLLYLSERCSPDFATQVAGLGPHQWLSFPPPLSSAEKGHTDASGERSPVLRAGRFGRASGASYGAAAQRDSETPRVDGGRNLELTGTEE